MSGHAPWRWMDRETYKEVRHKMMAHVKDLLSDLVVACDPDDDDLIFAYGLYAHGAVQFIWTRQSMRGRGLGSAVMEVFRAGIGQQRINYAVHTPDVENLSLVEKWRMRYRPWSLQR